jgi:HAD superfamily hydrolase (TIGR01509 family)
MIKAVIFDMDGVLIDTATAGRQVRKNILAGYGVDLDTVVDPQGEAHRASSLKTLLAAVAEQHGTHIDFDEFAEQGIAQLDQDLQARGVTADPALVTFLEALQQHSIACAIVSSGLRQGVNSKLRILGIEQYFKFIVTGSDVAEHKPHPEGYLHAMAKLGVPPQECVVFEDSLTGGLAALAAKCQVVGFVQYNLTQEALPGTLATVKSWSDIDYEKLMRLGSE